MVAKERYHTILCCLPRDFVMRNDDGIYLYREQTLHKSTTLPQIKHLNSPSKSCKSLAQPILILSISPLVKHQS